MPHRTRIDARRGSALARHLKAHHQVVDRATLIALGFSADYGSGQVDAGRWQRVHRGVYCAYTGPLAFLSRCEAALRAVGHDARIDGAAALRLNSRERGELDGPIEVAVRHGAVRRRVPGVRVRQAAAMTARCWWSRQNMPVLRPEWAAIAIARRHPARARATLAEVVQRGHVLPTHLLAVMLAIGSFRGRPRLMKIVSDIGGGSRSELEGIFLDLCRRAGILAPRRNFLLLLGERRAWLDACWPDLRIAVEIDGKAYHVLSEDWENDLDRQNDIVLGGWLVLRITATMLRDQPEKVVERLHTAICQAPARLSA